MGNTKIRKLLSPKRLFANKSDHKHKYSELVNIELNKLDNMGNIYSTMYYEGQKCEFCKALLVGKYIKECQIGLPVVQLKSNHTHTIDFKDVEYM